MNTRIPLAIAALFAVVSLSSAAPATSPASTLESRAKEIASLFKAKPRGFDTIFAPVFLASVPAEQLSKLLEQLHNQLGECTETKLIKKTGADSGEFEFTFSKGFAASVKMSIDPAAPHKVTGLFIGPPAPLVKSLDELAGKFKQLPGVGSLFVAGLNGNDLTPITRLNEDNPLAIGSAFKLYVLAELVRQIKTNERRWNDVIALEAKARSLPSGSLRDWPAGAPLTLYSLAALMISESDNTATDQLIRTLGREKIEAIVNATGNSSATKNVPFLATLEMFKLKGDGTGKLAERYLAADLAGRRKLLAGEIGSMSPNALSVPSNPSHIEDIEWFASTSDLARLMRWLMVETATGEAARARDILAINPGLPGAKQSWRYVGFKGGSEIGVLNLTLLLQSTGDQWFVISATQNDPKNAVDEVKFIGLIQRASTLLAQRGSNR